jgi:O-antigen/teichoic acid export membrane protein
VNKKNIVIYAIVFFVIFAIEFGLNSYLSFTIDKEQYLFYQNLMNVLPLFTTLLGFGTPFAVVYLTSLSKYNNKVYLLESNLFTLYFSLFLFSFCVILYNLEYLELYILIALILGFFNAIKQNSVNFYLAKKELNKSSVIRLNQKLIYLMVIVVSIYFLTINNDKTVSMILVTGEILGLLVLTFKYRIFLFSKFKKIKSILNISKYAFLSNLFSMISLATPIVLLNYFEYSSAEIISFSIAYSLLKYSGILLAPFMQLITPYFTPIKNDFEKVKILYKKYAILLFAFGIIISFVMFFLSEFIINTFFSQEYNNAVDIFNVLIFSLPFLFVNSFSMSLISSVISVKITSIIVLFTMLMMIIGNYFIHFFYLNIYWLSIFIVVYNLAIMFISSYNLLKERCN